MQSIRIVFAIYLYHVGDVSKLFPQDIKNGLNFQFTGAGKCLRFTMMGRERKVWVLVTIGGYDDDFGDDDENDDYDDEMINQLTMVHGPIVHGPMVQWPNGPMVHGSWSNGPWSMVRWSMVQW